MCPHSFIAYHYRTNKGARLCGLLLHIYYALCNGSVLLASDWRLLS